MHPPNVDFAFFDALIKSTPKLKDSYDIGRIRMYLFRYRASEKTIRYQPLTINEPVPYELAMGIAVKLGKTFCKDLLGYLEKEHNWKEGGYTVK